jgi:histidine triad (HIT) family protein
MEDCIFCKIINKEIPCHKVYEDEDNLAFLDVTPIAKGHTVIIPKEHSKTLTDISDEKLQSLFLAVKKVQKTLQDKLNPLGFNGGWNNEEVAGQTVPHLHIHVLPRYHGDGGGSVHSIVSYPQVPVEEVAELFKDEN